TGSPTHFGIKPHTQNHNTMHPGHTPATSRQRVSTARVCCNMLHGRAATRLRPLKLNGFSLQHMQHETASGEPAVEGYSLGILAIIYAAPAPPIVATSRTMICWPGGFASAIAVVLLACTLVLLGVYNRFAGLDR